MKWIKLLIFTVGFILIHSKLVLAQECSPEQMERAKELTEITAYKIVDGKLGGINVHSKLNSCEYFSDEQIFLISMSVGWNGAIWKKNYYEITGELRTSETGEAAEFKMISANEAAEKLAFWGKVGTLALDITSK